MLNKLCEIRDLLSGNLSYDNRAKAKEIVNDLITKEVEVRPDPSYGMRVPDVSTAVGHQDDIKRLSEQYVEKVVSMSPALTPTGVLAHLQDSMNECINKALDYQAVGRKTLSFSSDEKEFYPSKPMFLYDDTSGALNLVNPGFGEKIDPLPITISGSFKVKADPVFNLNRRVIDACSHMVKQRYEKQENEHILLALRKMATKCGKVTNFKSQHGNFFDRMAHDVIESLANFSAELVPVKLIGSMADIAKISRWPDFDSATLREMFTCNLRGHLITCDVYSCDRIPDGDLVVTASADDVGQMLILEPLAVKLEHNDEYITVSYSATIAIGLYENTSFILRFNR